jgi:hypothetical protein
MTALLSVVARSRVNHLTFTTWSPVTPVTIQTVILSRSAGLSHDFGTAANASSESEIGIVQMRRPLLDLGDNARGRLDRVGASSGEPVASLPRTCITA